MPSKNSLRFKCENPSCINKSIVYRKQSEMINTDCKLCHKPMKKLARPKHYVISDKLAYTTH